jgi:hypothetical protein
MSGHPKASINAMAPGYIVTDMNVVSMEGKDRAVSILARISAERCGNLDELLWYF